MKNDYRWVKWSRECVSGWRVRKLCVSFLEIAFDLSLLDLLIVHRLKWFFFSARDPSVTLAYPGQTFYHWATLPAPKGVFLTFRFLHCYLISEVFIFFSYPDPCLLHTSYIGLQSVYFGGVVKINWQHDKRVHVMYYCSHLCDLF